MDKPDYSIKDIARLSGVSIATLSRYFNGQSIRKDNEQKIKEVLQRTGYRPNVAARYMKGQSTGIIGLILPELTHPFFACIADGVISEASHFGLSVLTGSCDGSREKERQIIDQFSRSILDGLIYIPVSQAENIPSIESFRHLPLVVAARRSILPDVPHIYHDGFKGGYMATKYLIQLGRKDIAFIASFWTAPCRNGAELIEYLDNPISPTFSSCERLRGYLAALDEAGIPIDPDRIIITEYSYLGGKDAADKILEGCGQCNGMILMDQMVANGAEHQLQTQGVRVPQDISMIVYDSEDCAINFHFTTVNLQLREMGRQSLNTLYKLIHDGRSTVDNVCIDVKMILRESTTILR